MLAKLTTTFIVALLTVSLHGAPRGSMENPDFTKGDKIPEGAVHDWNLGSTGARGWIYSDKMVTSDARQIYITKVAKGSPVDGDLMEGDVILGVDGKKFTYDAREEFGKALTDAESMKVGLTLIRWRGGKIDNVVAPLDILGEYSKTAPFSCPKSSKIYQQGCEALAKRMAEEDYKENPIVRSLNALALLASGDEKYLPLLKKEAEFTANSKPGGYKSWLYGYTMIFLGEYVNATGDTSVLPGLRRFALETANGQSVVGSWGHRFKQEDGMLGGYGMMNSTGMPLTIGLILAREAGVDDPVVDQAIKKSARLLRFYVGKGAVPYGDHHPWIQSHEDNGKCGMAGVLFNLLGDKEAATFFSKMSLASHGSERDGGHTGNFFNQLWAMPGVALSGPNATGAWMQEYGAWYYDLTRQWDGRFIHQGPPSMRKDSYKNWDATGLYLLAYAMPLKKIYLTGKKQSVVEQLNEPEAKEILSAGYGRSMKYRHEHYDALTEGELLDRLSSWSPVVRERSAIALGRKKSKLHGKVIGLLSSESLHTRLGACQALAQMKSPSAVEPLRAVLKSNDLWLRVKAAEALGAIGKPSMVALPELLEMLAKGESQADPRGMEQRYLSFVVFDKMLKHDLVGVDKALLNKAVIASLKNEDGRARGSIGRVYKKLSYEELKPLLPAIYQATKEPAPSGIMFAAGIRLAGLELLAKHRIKEGIPLCLEVMDIDKWGKGNRIPRCLNAIAQYGGAAKPLLPQLRQLELKLSKHREAKKLKKNIDRLHELIETIEKEEAMPELRSI